MAKVAKVPHCAGEGLAPCPSRKPAAPPRVSVALGQGPLWQCQGPCSVLVRSAQGGAVLVIRVLVQHAEHVGLAGAHHLVS